MNALERRLRRLLGRGDGETGPIRLRYGRREFLMPRPPMRDNILDHIARRKRFFELELLEALRIFVPDGGLAVDVGANVGNHTLWFAGVMKMDVVAFEPVPTTHELLRSTVALNGLGDRVTLVPEACGAAEGSASMSEALEGNLGSFRIVDGSGSVSVPVATLDRHLGDRGLSGQVDILKVDVEGHEIAVLDGARDVIARSRPVVVVEVFDEDAYESCVSRLEAHGYRPVGVFGHTPTVVFSTLERSDAAARSKIRTFTEAWNARQAEGA